MADTSDNKQTVWNTLGFKTKRSKDTLPTPSITPTTSNAPNHDRRIDAIGDNISVATGGVDKRAPISPVSTTTSSVKIKKERRGSARSPSSFQKPIPILTNGAPTSTSPTAVCLAQNQMVRAYTNMPGATVSPSQSLHSHVGSTPKSVRSFTTSPHDTSLFSPPPNLGDFSLSSAPYSYTASYAPVNFPPDLLKSATEAAVTAAAQAAAKVAAEYFEKQQSNLLPSRPVSPTSEMSVDEKWVWSYEEEEAEAVTPIAEAGSSHSIGVAIDSEQLYSQLKALELGDDSPRPQSTHSASTVKAPQSPLSFTKRSPTQSREALVTSSITTSIAAEAERQPMDSLSIRSNESSSIQSMPLSSSCSAGARDYTSGARADERPDKS